MNVTILKSCDVRLDGVVKSLQAWTRLNLPDNKAAKLIDAGYAEPANIADEIGALMQEFGDRSPGGSCWDWIKKHKPELWSRHFKAFRQGDQDAARETYNAMISAWEERHDQQQPDLLAA